MMITKSNILEILSDIKFNDWKLSLGTMGDGWYLQWVFKAPDSATGVMSEQKSRKWYISPHSIPDEVVRCAWAALQRAILHEISEQFTYKDRAIFNRHISIEALLEASYEQNFRLQKEVVK